MIFTSALLALAVGAFCLGVTEATPMGLLPIIADDLQVSIPKAGLLVTAYALGVMLGAPVMTLATTRVPRKTLLIQLMAIFTLGNLLSALSGSYSMLLVGRIVTSISQGAFFGVGSVVAAGLVPENRRASAVASMFMGLTIANVGGVPFTSWVGGVIGWRSAFWVIAGLGAAAVVALWVELPTLRQGPAADHRAELAVLRGPAVLVSFLLTALGAGAMFSVFTYIAPILREQTHVSHSFVTAMLVVYGVGLTLGNWLGGRFADRSVDGTLIVVLAALTVLLPTFAVTMRWPGPAALTIFAWGVATFALVPPVQTRVMTAAAAAPNLAASLNISAFNLGNALGSATSGAVIAGGLGYPAVALTGAAISATGLLVLLAARSAAASAGKEFERRGIGP